MGLLDWIIGDQLKAQYSNTKFYLKQGSIMIIKAIMVLSGCLSALMILFMLITPEPIQKQLTPVFQVKKISQNNMITIYTNKKQKQTFCNNQSAVYYGKLYSKQQYCQFQHEYFPFDITDHHFVDITMLGIGSNVQYVTACIVKINQDRSVCQKFAHRQQIQVFNNLLVENLYSIQIQLTLKQPNQYFGQITIIFKQQINFLIRFLKQNYFWVSLFTTIIISIFITFSFVIFQIAQIMQKLPQSQQKIKKA